MMSRTIRHSRFASSGRIDRFAIYGFFRLIQTPGEQLHWLFTLSEVGARLGLSRVCWSRVGSTQWIPKPTSSICSSESACIRQTNLSSSPPGMWKSLFADAPLRSEPVRTATRRRHTERDPATTAHNARLLRNDPSWNIARLRNYMKYRKEVSLGSASPNSSRMPPTRRAKDKVTGHFPRISAVFQFIRVRLNTS